MKQRGLFLTQRLIGDWGVRVPLVKRTINSPWCRNNCIIWSDPEVKSQWTFRPIFGRRSTLQITVRNKQISKTTPDMSSNNTARQKACTNPPLLVITQLSSPWAKIVVSAVQLNPVSAAMCDVAGSTGMCCSPNTVTGNCRERKEEAVRHQCLWSYTQSDFRIVFFF